MAYPPPEDEITNLINEGIKRTSLKNAAIRINWSRGNNLKRGTSLQIEKYNTNKHRFWLEINNHEPSFKAISVMISKQESRNEKSILSQCKTFSYNQAIQAKYEANKAGFDDAILLNTANKLCCGSSSNILIKRRGTWFHSL